MEEEKRISTIEILKEAQPGQTSQVSAYTKLMALGKTVVKPTFEREELTMCYINSTNRRCVNAKAAVIAGMGYTLTDEESAKASGLLDFLDNIYDKNGVPKPFATLLKDFWADAEIYGESALECVRIGKQIENLLLLSARNTLKDPDRKTLYQFDRISNKVATFARYGKGKSGVNDVLSMAFETAEDSFYGVPCYISAIDSIKSLFKINNGNSESLDNIIDPSLLFVVTGYTVPNTEIKAAGEVLQNLKSKRSSAGLINFGDKDAKVETIKTGAGNIDGAYQQEKQAISLEIMALHGLTPELFGVLLSGGISSGEKATGALKIFLQTVVRPAQEALQKLVMMFIRKEFPAYKGEFILNTIDLTDTNEDATADLSEAQTYQALIATGSIVLLNEYRDRKGLEPIESAEFEKMVAGSSGMGLDMLKQSY